jgi:hypothetical protein
MARSNLDQARPALRVSMTAFTLYPNETALAVAELLERLS